MRTLMTKCVKKARSGQNYTFPGEIKINTRPGQAGESATKRAEPCSIEIFQHPVSDQPLSICQEIESTEVSHESMARATIRIPRSKFAYGMLVEFVGFRSSGQLHLLKPSVLSRLDAEIGRNQLA